MCQGIPSQESPWSEPMGVGEMRDACAFFAVFFLFFKYLSPMQCAGGRWGCRGGHQEADGSPELCPSPLADHTLLPLTLPEASCKVCPYFIFLLLPLIVSKVRSSVLD